MKTNIDEIVDAIKIVENLQGRTFEWNDRSFFRRPGERTIGFIAQEVQRVLPEVVRQDPETGLYSVSYAELLPVLLEAFKEHLREYRADHAELRNQMLELRSIIYDIRKGM